MPNFKLQAIYELQMQEGSFMTAKEASKKAILRLDPFSGDKRLKQINLIREMPKSSRIIKIFYREGEKVKEIKKL